MDTLFPLPTPAKSDAIERDARFTKTGRRFLLTRRWNGATNDSPYVLFVMLNPSTANATVDDPTIRKVMKYARSWGYDHLQVMNLFSYVTPSPDELLKWWHSSPMLPKHNGTDAELDIMKDVSRMAKLTVCAWGAVGGWFPERMQEVMDVLTAPHAIHTTRTGLPGHPLYLPADARPKPFSLPLEPSPTFRHNV